MSSLVNMTENPKIYGENSLVERFWRSRLSTFSTPTIADITARISLHVALSTVDWGRQRLKRLFETRRTYG